MRFGALRFGYPIANRLYQVQVGISGFCACAGCLDGHEVGILPKMSGQGGKGSRVRLVTAPQQR